MTCNIPKIENYNPVQPEYKIDIAINGQQFSGYLSTYRFYDVYIEKIIPDISKPKGDLPLVIYGSDLFDSPNKKHELFLILVKRI